MLALSEDSSSGLFRRHTLPSTFLDDSDSPVASASMPPSSSSPTLAATCRRAQCCEEQSSLSPGAGEGLALGGQAWCLPDMWAGGGSLTASLKMYKHALIACFARHVAPPPSTLQSWSASLGNGAVVQSMGKWRISGQEEGLDSHWPVSLPFFALPRQPPCQVLG